MVFANVIHPRSDIVREQEFRPILVRRATTGRQLHHRLRPYDRVVHFCRRRFGRQR